MGWVSQDIPNLDLSLKNFTFSLPLWQCRNNCIYKTWYCWVLWMATFVLFYRSYCFVWLDCYLPSFCWAIRTTVSFLPLLWHWVFNCWCVRFLHMLFAPLCHFLVAWHIEAPYELVWVQKHPSSQWNSCAVWAAPVLRFSHNAWEMLFIGLTE